VKSHILICARAHAQHSTRWRTTTVAGVYRIRVKDEQGNVRSGLATIGSKTMGTLVRTIDVKLDP